MAARAAARKREDPPLSPVDEEPTTRQGRPSSIESARNKRSLDYVLRSGLAGGFAGCAAKTVVAPLDRVKILFQTSNPQFAKYTGSWFGFFRALSDVYSQAGPAALFKGHSATLLRIFPYASIKFLAYEQIRALVIKEPEQETPLRRLLSGSLAGMTSVMFTYPLEVIRVRLAFETKGERHKGALREICRQIYHEQPPSMAKSSGLEGSIAQVAQTVTPRRGLVNFYRGFSPTMWGMLPYAGVSFLTHDVVGDWLRHPTIADLSTLPNHTMRQDLAEENRKQARRPPLKLWAELLSGAMAGLVSQTASYPLEVIRRRMQVGGAVGDGHRLRMAETTGLIWKERGFRGFWIGLGIGYLKVVPMVAISFFAYERGKLWLGI